MRLRHAEIAGFDICAIVQSEPRPLAFPHPPPAQESAGRADRATAVELRDTRTAFVDEDVATLIPH